MSKKIVFTENAPKPIGPYSQAAIVGNLVFISGQIPIDPKTSKVIKGGIEEQTIQVLENLNKILESVELKLINVVKVTIFLSNLNLFQSFNKVYSKYFVNSPPARTTVQAGLLDEVLIELDAIAEKS